MRKLGMFVLLLLLWPDPVAGQEAFWTPTETVFTDERTSYRLWKATACPDHAYFWVGAMIVASERFSYLQTDVQFGGFVAREGNCVSKVGFQEAIAMLDRGWLTQVWFTVFSDTFTLPDEPLPTGGQRLSLAIATFHPPEVRIDGSQQQVHECELFTQAGSPSRHGQRRSFRWLIDAFGCQSATQRLRQPDPIRKAPWDGEAIRLSDGSTLCLREREWEGLQILGATCLTTRFAFPDGCVTHARSAGEERGLNVMAFSARFYETSPADGLQCDRYTQDGLGNAGLFRHTPTARPRQHHAGRCEQGLILGEGSPELGGLKKWRLRRASKRLATGKGEFSGFCP